MPVVTRNLWWSALVVPAVLFLFSVLHADPSSSAGIHYYLDCDAPQNGNGTESSPWNSPVSVNAFTFRPGDHLLLKRGSTCNAALNPQGSGSSGAPIVLDAYGEGALPILNGGTAEAALKLFNQEYWEIGNLEIVGGNLYGLLVSGDKPKTSLHHIYLRNLDVHGAHFNSVKRADSGLVFVHPNGPEQTLEDVLVDGVKAHDSHASEGIFVNAGGMWMEGNGFMQPRGRNVIVRNSIAHDIYGDGILISELYHGLLEHNVVYRSGLCPNCTGSTPVGLWQWYCDTCLVQFNESYANQSWDVDGGDFDIDYFNDHNVVQYNYGHDSAGYCVAFFGAGGRATHDNIFRYNVCSNNGRRSDLSRQGEIYLHTWDQGSLDGVQIYNNTIHWNPAVNAAAFTTSDAVFTGDGPRFFKNNIIYSTVPSLVLASASFVLDYNLYFTTSASGPSWQYGGITYTDFKSFQAATKQDQHSLYADPKLTDPSYHAPGPPATALHLTPGSPALHKGANICLDQKECTMGPQDFWGAPLQPTHAPSIGAHDGA